MMTKARRQWSAVVVLGILLVLTAGPGSSSATLVGDQVTCADGGTAVVCSSASAVVSELAIEFAGRLHLDVGPTSITLYNLGPAFTAQGQTIVVGDLNFSDGLGPIAGLARRSQGVADLPEASLTFTADSVTIQLGSSTWAPTIDTTTQLRLQLLRTPDGGGTENRPPTLEPIGSRTAREGEPFQLTVTAVDPDGHTLMFSGADLPTGATLVDNGDGSASLLWTPSFTQTGNHLVTIVATDSGSPALSASEAFTITVGIFNRPPVLGPIGDVTVNAEQRLELTIGATDPDSDALSIAGANLPEGASLVDHANGTATFAWTPTAAQIGTHVPRIIVTDSGSPPQATAAEFRITVGEVNRPPVLGAIGNRLVKEGQHLSITVTATDPDGDRLSFTGTPLPPGAVLLDDGSGSATLLWTPGFDQAGNHPATVTVTDGAGLSASETFLVTVGEVNRPPVLAPIGDRVFEDGQSLMITLTAADPDGDRVSFTAAKLPTGANLFDSQDGTAVLAWTPAPGEKSAEVTVVVTDSGQPPESDSETFIVTVKGPDGERKNCKLGVHPKVLDFGPIGVGTTATLTAMISNLGKAACVVTTFTVSPGFVLGADAPGLPASVPADATLNVPVAYAPSAIGAASGTLAIATNDGKEPVLLVGLNGRGVAGPGDGVDGPIVGFLASDRVGLENPGKADEEDDDGEPVVLLVLVANGNQDGHLKSITVTGVQNGREVYRQTQDAWVAGGQQMPVRFPPYIPRAWGAIVWTASIADDSTSPAAIAVTAVGRSGD